MAAMNRLRSHLQRYLPLHLKNLQRLSLRWNRQIKPLHRRHLIRRVRLKKRVSFFFFLIKSQNLGCTIIFIKISVILIWNNFSYRKCFLTAPILGFSISLLNLMIWNKSWISRTCLLSFLPIINIFIILRRQKFSNGLANVYSLNSGIIKKSYSPPLEWLDFVIYSTSMQIQVCTKSSNKQNQ